jgi:sugar phosphate isomerase/epimerase
VSPPRLALHTWSLDTTPLDGALAAARQAGWDAIELRRVDFDRAAAAGGPAESVLGRVKASGLPVACVGVEFGWMWADGAERARLLRVFDEQCARAVACGAGLVMSPVDKGRGPVARAAAGVREVGDIAARHGVRLALEFNSQAEQLNTLARVREVLASAGHPACGLLLDTYHLGRSGWPVRELEDLEPSEIAYVQFSDVPATGVEPGQIMPRLPPGRGVVDFKTFFALIRAKSYAGPLSYEAPDPEAWKRPPAEVARQALEATRRFL